MKKHYILFLFISVICFFSFVNAQPNYSKLRLLSYTIYLDPGHGGRDPGCTYKNIYEKDINLKICKKLKNLLEKEGAVVYMTRDDDYDLSTTTTNRKRSDLLNRARIINRSGSDIYISIHLNSIGSSTWSGAQVFYDDTNSNNKKFANVMQKRLQKDLNVKRKAKEIKDMLMNKKIRVNGILIEAGFLSNPSDRYLLVQDTYQQKISESITNGIIEYLN